MIADLDETLQQLLITELPIRSGEVEISFHQPKREWSARLSRPTINLFLYDLRENMHLRSQQWEQLPVRGPENQARLKRSPLRVDCYYMITVWATEPEDEHRLLSRCLTTLYRFPALPAERLAGELHNQQFELQLRLAVSDALPNPAEVWSALDNEMRPAVAMMVTLAIDPWQEITAPLVSTRTLRAGQSDRPRRETLSGAGADPDRITIGGTVRTPKGEPRPGIQVAIKGTGLFATSDTQGRFVLGSLPAGAYILVAWPPSGKPKERPIAVPSKDGHYDLNLEEER